MTQALGKGCQDCFSFKRMFVDDGNWFGGRVMGWNTGCLGYDWI